MNDKRQIDLDPHEYRKQDRLTGRWLQNVDRKLCRWASLIGPAWLIYVLWAMDESTSPVLIALSMFMFGALSGGLLILSFRKVDW